MSKTNSMELTKEEIAKVFAMYLGCKVKCSKSGALADVYSPYACADYGYWQLLLTPLSEITDEHAVEVARAFNSISKNIDDKSASEYGKSVVEVCMQDVNTYCHLISKGYDVPIWFGINHWANGKTAIELGIAISNQKKSNSREDVG